MTETKNEEKQRLILWNRKDFDISNKYALEDENESHKGHCEKLRAELSRIQSALNDKKIQHKKNIESIKNRNYEKTISHQREYAKEKGWNILENSDSKEVK